MGYTFGMVIALVCLVLGIMSIRILFDTGARPGWAKACIGLLAGVALVAATLTGLGVSGRAVLSMKPPLDRGMGTFFRGFTTGLFVVLAFSGQWSLKSPLKC